MRLWRGKAVLVSSHLTVCVSEIGYGGRVPERLSLKKLHEKNSQDENDGQWEHAERIKAADVP